MILMPMNSCIHLETQVDKKPHLHPSFLHSKTTFKGEEVH